MTGGSMTAKISSTLRRPFQNSSRGFLGWEMILVIVLVFGILAFALFMLRKSYSACTNEGYTLLECVFNSPAEDPYDQKEAAPAANAQKTKAGTRSALN